jgi:hypothetical protein
MLFAPFTLGERIGLDQNSLIYFSSFRALTHVIHSLSVTPAFSELRYIYKSPRVFLTISLPPTSFTIQIESPISPGRRKEEAGQQKKYSGFDPSHLNIEIAG